MESIDQRGGERRCASGVAASRAGRCGPAGRRSQGGAALVVALLIFALCSALLVALLRDFTLSFQRASNRFFSEQSWVYLRAAEELAVIALRVDFEGDQRRDEARDDLTEIWAQPRDPYPLEDGAWLDASLEDLQGRFNLNSLVVQTPAENPQGPQRYAPAQQLFIRLLQSFEDLQLSEYEAITITESIGDWLDADSNPRFNGAEATFYASRTPPYRPSNGPMRDVSELLAIANITPELYLALQPLVTVWPETARALNIHTALPQLFRALNVRGDLRPLSAEEAQALADYRLDTGFRDVEDFLEQPVFADAQENERAALQALLGESSAYFMLSARVEIADRDQRMYSVLRREERQIDVLQRVRGAL